MKIRHIERLQSQIDREKSKLSNTGGNDDRQRQRAKQLENSIIKIKSDQDDAQSQLDDMGSVPPADRQAYGSAKSEYKTLVKKFENQSATFEKTKKESDKCVNSAKGDIDSLMHKRTRFEAREKEYAAKLADTIKNKDQAAQ